MPGKWRQLLTRTTVSATVSLLGWRLLGPSPSAKVIQEMGNAFSQSLAVAMGNDPHPLIPKTMEERIRELEHELMIAGHEFECPICIENNMTVHQKAIRAMRKAWHANRPR